MMKAFHHRILIIVAAQIFSIIFTGIISDFKVNIQWWPLVIGIVVTFYFFFIPYVKKEEMFVPGSILEHFRISDKILRFGYVLLCSLLLSVFIFDVNSVFN